VSSAGKEQAARITREAYAALLQVKTLVDRAADTVRVAEREAVGWAIGRGEDAVPIAALQSATAVLQSPQFEAAIMQARSKIDSAVVCLLNTRIG
jgi:hypothetical protein